MKLNLNPFKSEPRSQEEIKELQEKQKELFKDDLDYVEDCKAALIDEKLPWANRILYLFLFFIIVFFLWAGFAKIDTRAQGLGQVIPSKNIQEIQSLEGGLLSEILVKVGDVVQKGDVLIRIDDTIFNSSYKENLSKYDVYLAKISRLTAEAANKENFDVPPGLEQRRPDIVAKERQLFHERRDDLKTSVARFEENLSLAQQELDIKAPLAKDGVISQVELLAAKRTVNSLQSDLENAKSTYYKQTLEELTKSKAEFDGLQESIRAFQDRVDRTIIRSPVYGTIKDIMIQTIGGVVRSGENIMEIVPLDDTLLIKTRIRPADIGFIHPGQKALVKFTAYDFAMYGGLEGVVENISADTITDPVAKETYYEIRVRTYKNYLGPEWHPLPIIPGMVAQVSIVTGKKTILQYLLKPIIKAKDNAFTER